MSDRIVTVPRHVAIIMDGNGRWAKRRHLPRTAGHREGIFRVKEIVQAAAELGIEVITLFAFSTENWSRPQHEIKALMRFLQVYLDREVENLCRNNIKLRFIGRRDPLPPEVIRSLRQAEEKTKPNSGLTLVLAINYGSRQEIVDAIKAMLKDCARGTIDALRITEETLSSYLYTAGLADPDLLIRTSGEQRISNFLLWQLSYTELYFTDKCWPDFKKNDFLKLWRRLVNAAEGLAES